jgi:putative peptidoglycan lipid II flippase
MKHTILRASAAVSAATILIRLLGFLREVVLAASFGAGAVTDAFVIAMTVPGIVLAVVNNSINASFIPQYVSSDKDSGRFTDSLLTLLFLFGLAFSVIFTVFPQALVYIFAANIETETFELALTLMRITVWSSIPLLLAGVLRGFLQIKGVFFVALAADGIVNLLVIASIAAGKMTGLLLLMGAGAVAGNMILLLLLLALGVRRGLRYRPRVDLRDERIRAMFRQMLPLMLSVSVLEINQIVDKNLASALVSGTVTSLNYAVKVSNIVTALIGASISTALFPKMSELAANGDIDAIKKHLVACLTNLLPLLLPLTVGVMFMSRPIIRILLERGAFNPDDTARTAECLRMYAIGIIAGNLTPLITRAFYAMRRAKLPAALSAISVAVGIALNLLLIGSMKHQGLAFATSASNTLCLILLLIALRKKTGALGLRPQLGEFVKVAAATAVMGCFVAASSHFLPLLSGSYIQCVFWSAAVAVAAAVLYGGLLLLLRVKTVISIAQKLL